MLPQAFIQQMCALLGDAEAGALCSALTNEAPPVSIRHNPLKSHTDLAQTQRVPWCDTGEYLNERPAFTFDPRLHAGCYYVQEAASMFIEQAYRQITLDFLPQRVLDLCAAPGGKSTLWRTLLNDGALLVANEPMRQRAQILAENLTKWGHPDVVVSNAFPEEFAPLSGFFDVVATDVPCSGEGMFRKDEQAQTEWSPSAVTTCAERQRNIISDIWHNLREGGYLVYSTCTFNRDEDEDNVVFICKTLGAELVPIPTLEAWNIVGDTTQRQLPVYHFFPHRTKGEGIFLALLRKTSATVLTKDRKPKKGGGKTPPIAHATTLTQWLSPSSDFRLFRTGESYISAVRTTLFDDVQRIQNAVRTLSAGILLAEEKGKKNIPQHPLALSTALATDAFPRIEVDHSTAIAYLRREAISLAPEVPKGYVLICFEQHPLGFVNNLGNRANNLYPSEWRIRKSFT